MIAGTTTAELPEDPFADDEDVQEPQWETGTVLDEFLPIYLMLARWTDRHGPISPGDVDRSDISVIATLLGVDGGDSFEAIAADWRNEYDVEMERFAREQETARTGM